MTVLRLLPLICLVLATPCALAQEFPPPTVESLMAQSQKLSEQKKYDEALSLLKYAQGQDPSNDEVRLAIARVLSWQGEYAAAEREVRDVLSRHPDDADAELVLANLHFYQEKINEAEQEYAAIVKVHPEYAEAQQGLKDAEAAKAPGHGFNWQADSGYEYSNFSRRPQTSWNQEFLQVTRFLDGGDTAVHVRGERDDEFSQVDGVYEIGVSQRFSPRLNGYVTVAATPHADFKPRYDSTVGGAVRLDDPQPGHTAYWLTLDTRYDDYTVSTVETVDPGLRIEPWDNWALIGQQINVHTQGSDTAYGWLGRLDGQFYEGCRFFGGYSKAPDTEAGVTAMTRTFFGGLAFDIDNAHTLNFAYTHDNREQSYIRQVIDADITFRF